MNSPGNGVTGQIPSAYRRIGIPAGSDLRIRTKPGGTPPKLIVEAADGTDLLNVTITADGMLDMKYDPARITEAAQRLLVEAQALLHPDTGSAGARIRVNTQDTGRPPEAGATDL